MDAKTVQLIALIHAWAARRPSAELTAPRPEIQRELAVAFAATTAELEAAGLLPRPDHTPWRTP